MNTDKVKPTKVTMEDVELADEIVRVTAIKELVSNFTADLAGAFVDLIAIAEGANPVATYKAVGETESKVMLDTQILQSNLLEVLGRVDVEDAHELADPESGIGTNIKDANELDAALAAIADVDSEDRFSSRLTNSESLDIPLEES